MSRVKIGWKTLVAVGGVGVAVLGLMNCGGGQLTAGADTPAAGAVSEVLTAATDPGSDVGWRGVLVDEGVWRESWEPVYGPVRRSEWSDAVGVWPELGGGGGRLVLHAADGLNVMTQVVVEGGRSTLRDVLRWQGWVAGFSDSGEGRCVSVSTGIGDGVVVAAVMESLWCHHDQTDLMDDVVGFIVDNLAVQTR